MELRYCEECGDVIRLDSDEPGTLHDHFLCAKCKGEEPAAGNGAASQTDGARAFSVEDLDLFSSQSIALRRQENESAVKKAPQPRLRLVKTTATSGAGAEALSPDAPDVSADAEAPPEAPAPANPAPNSATTAGEPGAQESGGRPAKSARKIIFRCLHCKSPLSIRPVEKTSKLVCPSCRQAVYVTPNGRLLKKNPSVAVRKETGVNSSGRQARNVEVAALATAPSPTAAEESAAAGLAEARERLSAFEEHIFSQDPNKTAFLTEESAPLSDLGDSEREDFPLANEFLSSATHLARSEEYEEEEYEEEEYEEEWPGESDLLAEDEFDENLGSGSRKRVDTRRPPTARVLLVGLALLLPFVLVVGLFVAHFSEPERLGLDSKPVPTLLEKLGDIAQRGLTTLLAGDEEENDRWLPGKSQR